MKAKYWQWLKENEKPVFRSTSNTNEGLGVNHSRFPEHLMSRCIFSSSAWSLLTSTSTIRKGRKQDVITKYSAVAVHL